MCFSAGASFGVSAVLLTTAALSYHKSASRSQIPFAAIPLLFGVQQLCEGLVWISFNKPEMHALQIPSVYAFMVFAQVFWPFWVPYSMYRMEQDPRRKKILKALLMLGSLTGLYLLYCLSVFEVGAVVESHHIKYLLDFPHNRYLTLLSGIFYFIPTIIPAFVSGVPKIKTVGIALLLTFIVSKLYFRDYLVSVWCILAACISVLVLYVLSQPYPSVQTRNMVRGEQV